MTRTGEPSRCRAIQSTCPPRLPAYLPAPPLLLPAPATPPHQASAGTRGRSQKPPLEPKAGPRQEFRTIDLGNVLAGPFADALLADLGCEVIKVKVPERDSFRAGVFSRLECDYEQFAEHNPAINPASTSAFAETSLRTHEPVSDALLQSRSGTFAAQGGDDGPVCLGVPIRDGTSAALPTLATVISLYSTHLIGNGKKAEVTMVGASDIARARNLSRLMADRHRAQGTGRVDFATPDRSIAIIRQATAGSASSSIPRAL